MSQITRCPSCATAFKVVADQLRISEGWVRCGQCKEVFDASAHLLALAPAALLPDFPLPDKRSTSAVESHRAHGNQGWGHGSTVDAVAPPGQKLDSSPIDTDSAESEPLPDFSVRDEDSVAAPAPLVAPVPDCPEAAGPLPADALGQERNTPRPWSALEEPPTNALDSAARAGEVIVDPAASTLAGLTASGEVPVSVSVSVPLASLPEPQLEPDASEMPAPALDPFASVPSFDPVGSALAVAGDKAESLHDQSVIDEAACDAPQEMGVSLPSKQSWDSAAEAEAEAEAEALPGASALGEVDASAGAVQATAHTPTHETQLLDDNAADDGGSGKSDQEAQPEASFVVTARRKAFWRKPAVRATLVVLMLVCLVGLALQIAVQERNRIAAMDSRMRPWLLALCEPLGCEIAPHRHIADVVIDSSSFTKARGDSYQLSLTMKSNADIALELPAVEITLTDAQDEPVLRRILLPVDMAAPAELQAHGSWSTSIAVIVTTGGARVAGYRLLAFYP